MKNLTDRISKRKDGETVGLMSPPCLSQTPDILNSLTRVTSQVALVVKNPPANAGDLRELGSINGSGIFPGERHGNPLQYSCLENPMDRETWQAIVHRVSQSEATYHVLIP